MNKVFAIIGPAGSGKSSILKALKRCPGVVVMLSHTTRPPHPDEENGIHYHFVSKDEFTKMILIERVTYAGQFYGLSKDEVMSKVAKYPVSFVDIDLDGFRQLKKLLGERLESIYILVDKETILTRYVSEGRSDDEIRRRLEFAEKQGEFNNWQIADHVVKNTSGLDVAVRQILAIANLQL